ncbi:response regulator transcription factor [Piscinibacter gummiphilus]|uniref:Response regulator transcription factor n=1 Tax=Piscinibacter gummiphilus TaxID=946333 RepID=A0ABZ0CYQ3_9BURK|nr:response regulator transcription factor [Piscinibacter gummiphilus]WOB10098.1 response regulator transcription factor [Piscinibacter gummiphilus]
MNTPLIRLCIVDDHPLVREGLKARLSTVAEFEVVAEAEDAEATLAMLAADQPDIVLMDIGMKAVNGIELTRIVSQRHPDVSVLILSMYDNPEYVAQAMQAGARGYVLKDSPSAQIVSAIQSVAAGGTFFSPSIANGLFSPKSPERCLSMREQEILSLLARGLSSKHIAKQLDISVRTVESHRQSIKRKLNIDGQAELIKFAVERFRL